MDNHTLEALKGLKEVSESLRAQLLVVLRSHLDADLQVLADVGGEHGLQTLKGILDRQGAKVVHQPLGRNGGRGGGGDDEQGGAG